MLRSSLPACRRHNDQDEDEAGEDDVDDEADLAGPNNEARWLLFPLFVRCSTAVTIRIIVRMIIIGILSELLTAVL